MSAANITLEVDMGIPFFLGMQLMDVDAGGSDIPFDLTGCSLVAGIRPRAGMDPRIGLTVTITDAANGMIGIEPEGDAVLSLPLESYAWDMVITDSGGRRYPIMRGPVSKLGVISI